MRFTVSLCLALCAVALISACSRSAGERSEVFDLKTSAAAAAQSMSSQVAPAAPAGPADFVVSATSMGEPSAQNLINISWKDGAGKLKNLLEEAKGKVVVINFWATWCPPCRREIPDLVDFARDNKDVYVIGVALEKDDATAKEGVTKFAESKGINYVNVTSSESLETRKIAAAYANIAPMDYIPVTIIFNKAGQHVNIIQGGTTKQALIDAVAKAQ